MPAAFGPFPLLVELGDQRRDLLLLLGNERPLGLDDLPLGVEQLGQRLLLVARLGHLDLTLERTLLDLPALDW